MPQFTSGYNGDCTVWSHWSPPCPPSPSPQIAEPSPPPQFVSFSCVALWENRRDVRLSDCYLAWRTFSSSPWVCLCPWRLRASHFVCAHPRVCVYMCVHAFVCVCVGFVFVLSFGSGCLCSMLVLFHSLEARLVPKIFSHGCVNIVKKKKLNYLETEKIFFLRSGWHSSYYTMSWRGSCGY